MQGPGTQEFALELRQDFAKVAWHRPQATRSESKVRCCCLAASPLVGGGAPHR